ncbi:hypothetical protein [Devosia aurantiaca]|uniref:Phage tail tape measure protein n=1 Tax=Devosia aurantiaca TaxID=2714858 RepID=A0A6M1SU69_9HYPH|nr:hypothetical protein [Devosia aurantiaca]NGP18695.1 hypothetical protein [Devosia aurantiaca]
MATDLFGESFRDELSDVSVELGRIGDLADGVARSVSRAFRGAVTDGKSFRSVLGDIAGAFADIALKAAFKPLGTLVGGLVENLLPRPIRRSAGLRPLPRAG